MTSIWIQATHAHGPSEARLLDPADRGQSTPSRRRVYRHARQVQVHTKTDLGPSNAHCFGSALDAQEDLVEAFMAELRKLASTGSTSAAAALGSFQPDARNTTMCNAIKFGALEVGPSAAVTVYGVAPAGQAVAVLARGAWAPSGNRRLNQNTANAIENQ